MDIRPLGQTCWGTMMLDLHPKGSEDIKVVSPTSSDGYSGIDENRVNFFRTAWTSLITADILRKMLLKTRPYEKVKGTTDSVYEKGLERAERVLEKNEISFNRRLDHLKEELIKSRDDFRAIDADYVKGKPLLGIL